MAAVVSLGLAACGSDDAGSDGAEAAETQTDAVEATGERPTIAVTTNVLGDVVEQVVGESADVVTIMPVGTDPHDFQASAQEVDAMNTADALIVNGAAFEEGLLDVIEGAEGEGVPTFEAISAVDTIEFGDGVHEHSDDDHSDDDHSDDDHSDDEHDDEHSDEEHDEHSDEEHGNEDHDDKDDEHDDDKDQDHDDDHDGHDHSGDDPHFFTDPMRMAVAVDEIVEFLLEEVTFADPAALEASAAAYVDELAALDEEVVALVETIPEERRVLVTNHDVFGYFADRYGFEIVGAAIPTGSTTDGASAGELAELAEQIEQEAVPAIFGDTSSSDDLVNALADEVGEIMVVELYSESLGEAGSDGATYLDMVRTNAQRMSSALS